MSTTPTTLTRPTPHPASDTERAPGIPPVISAPPGTDTWPVEYVDAHTARELRRAGIRDVLAVAPGVAPFGVALGVAITGTSTGTLAGLAGSAAVYAGSAQLSAVTVLDQGAGIAAAVAAATVVNARLLLYGAGLAERFQGQPRWFRLLGPHFLIDQTYLAATARTGVRGASFRRYWGWMGFVLLAVWSASVGTGLLLGPVLPPMPHLALVGATLFIGMLVPRLCSKPAAAAAVVGATVALGLAGIAPGMAIATGAAAGMLAGSWVGRRSRS